MNEKENDKNPIGKWTRLLLGIILPIFTGFIIINLIKIILHSFQTKSFVIEFDYIYVSLIFIPILSGFQSLLYTVIMEFWVNKICKSYLMVVGISSLMGGVSSYIAICIVYQGIIVTLEWEFIVIGIIVGLITGTILRSHYKKSSYKSQQLATLNTV